MIHHCQLDKLDKVCKEDLQSAVSLSVEEIISNASHMLIFTVQGKAHITTMQRRSKMLYFHLLQ